MTINLNAPINLEFENDLLKHAADEAKVLEQSAHRFTDGKQTEELMDALLTVMLFRKMEKTKPGTIQSVIDACQASKRA